MQVIIRSPRIGEVRAQMNSPLDSRNPQEIRPASPVTLVGRIAGEPEIFDHVQDGDPIEILPG